ncbi:hypothetical protein [Amycolatopsis sp. FDAARGOS 1241]|uniref:hypothetical protein n=1 Tax=Amycolatopsis sp. FDAARGOS 1241 TaxID=2778070 RepID=UPI001EF34DF8|nr:hypothetical protein [Amycolatopsis sp. FDAARGOS 1241]
MTAVVEPVARLAALPGVSTASRVAEQAAHAKTTGRVLPVSAALAGLLPDPGLRRGSTVAVHHSTSLLLALLAEATAAGSWAAVVGVPSLGIAAAAEHGVDVSRLALVPRPGAEYPAVVAALLDGVDLVVTEPRSVRPPVARRLSARARHRGAVLLSLGPWPAADLELHCTPGPWSGFLGAGAGFLRTRDAEVHARGRGSAARPRSATLALPGPGGRALPADPAPVLLPVQRLDGLDPLDELDQEVAG